MLYKYIVRESTFGLAVFLDMTQQNSDHIDEDCTKIIDSVLLRICTTNTLKKEFVLRLASWAIRDMENVLSIIKETDYLVFTLKSLDINLAHFQDEAIYYAVQNWIYTYNKIPIPPVDVKYDYKKRRFLFPISGQMDAGDY